MTVSKKPMLSEYGTLCTGESTWSVFASHMTIPYTTAIFPKEKPLNASSILFSVPPKADYSGVLFLYLAEDLTANHHSYLLRTFPLNK